MDSEDFELQDDSDDETQIWQEPHQTREVALYLQTSNGKVQGPEHTPFELPKRWTFDSLKSLIVDYIKRKVQHGTIVIDQLYYKKAKGKSLVLLNGDGDIPSMLKEYPLTYRNGKRKESATMYMAADFTAETGADQSATTPRRSPRLLSKNPTSTMDVFVYEMTADKKVLTTSNVLHKVSCDAKLEEITTLLQTYPSDTTIYTPTTGLFWLRKGTKQPVSLSSDQDLDTCKAEYKSQSMRLACRVVDIQRAVGSATTSRKRRLDMSSAANSENTEWNDTHVQLVEDLEKRGTLWRFNTKHLTLWTDEIMKGNSVGINQEPDWEKHIEVVLVPPKSQRRKSNSPQDKKSDQSGVQSTLEMMIALEAKRNESLQSVLMMMMTQTTAALRERPPMYAQLPTEQPKAQSKPLKNYNLDECCDFLCSLKLDKYMQNFRLSKMDGALLSSLVHPQFGYMLLTEMGIKDERDIATLISAVKMAL